MSLKARCHGLERQSVCYLHYPFCDMLPGCKVLGPSKQDLIRAIRQTVRPCRGRFCNPLFLEKLEER